MPTTECACSFLRPFPFPQGENAGTSFGILVMHPFNFLPGLQSGKEGQQGIISGVIRLKTFVEQFLKVGPSWIPTFSPMHTRFLMRLRRTDIFRIPFPPPPYLSPRLEQCYDDYRP